MGDKIPVKQHLRKRPRKKKPEGMDTPSSGKQGVQIIGGHDRGTVGGINVVSGSNPGSGSRPLHPPRVARVRTNPQGKS